MDRPAASPDADAALPVTVSAAVRISGADRVRRSAAGAFVLDAPAPGPAPHHVHRPPVAYPDDLPREALLPAVDGDDGGRSEAVWEGATRMLKRVGVARRLHPAGRARPGRPQAAQPS